MDKNDSAVDKFLMENDEQDLFAQPEPTEEKKEEQEVEEEVEEKPIPFNRDPKILKFIEKEVSKRLDSRSDDISTKTQTEDEFKEVVDSFTTIIGNDTPEKVQALKSLERALKGSNERAAQIAEQKIEEIRLREEQADKEAEDELADAFDTIEETFDVDLTSNKASKIRSEFVSFVERIAPKDRNGEVIDYPDMVSAWETFSEIKMSNKQPSRAKELASRSISRSSETSTTTPKRIDWNAADEFIENLK